MAKKKRRGLGSQGISALVSQQKTPVPVKQPDKAKRTKTSKTTDAVGGDNALVYIAIDSITPNRYQPRASFDPETLATLADSIRNDGLLQPLVVRPTSGNGRYELVAGERRWRAAQQCKLEKVPALVRDVDEQQSATLALIENLQREDLSPLEEASALEQLIVKFELSHEVVAKAVGRSRSAVTNLLRLLKLGPEARELLSANRLEMGHARALLGLPTNRAQADCARIVVEQGLTTRATEQLVAKWLRDQDGTKTVKKTKDVNTAALERELSEALGANVSIQHGQRGGKVIIRYTNLDMLDSVLAKIKR